MCSLRPPPSPPIHQGRTKQRIPSWDGRTRLHPADLLPSQHDPSPSSTSHTVISFVPVFTLLTLSLLAPRVALANLTYPCDLTLPPKCLTTDHPRRLRPSRSPSPKVSARRSTNSSGGYPFWLCASILLLRIPLLAALRMWALLIFPFPQSPTPSTLKSCHKTETRSSSRSRRRRSSTS